MPSQFAAQTLPLGQLLANPYVIHTPPYQRSFSWEQRDASRLLEELIAALESDSNSTGPDDYFLGTMLFIEVQRPARRPALPFSRPARVLEVVDGLQRLTTLTILLCLLRDLDAQERVKSNDRLLAAINTGRSASSRRRFELRGPDEAFFHAQIRTPMAAHVTSSNGLSPAQEKIVAVRDCIQLAVRELDPGQRKRLLDFLLDKCHLVAVTTTGIDRAHRIFTVLNARGKPLARNDILKAELLGSVPATSREAATAIWDGAKASLEAEFDDLFSHIRAIHGRSSAPVIASILAIADEAGGAHAFIEKILHPAADILNDILTARHRGAEHSASISALLTYLGRLKGQSDWVPPLLLWWLQKGNEPAEVAWFLGELDRLAYGLRILGHGTKRRAGRFNAVIQAIRNGRDLKAPGSPLDLTRDELRNIHHSLRDIHARSAPIAKLVLLRINDHMTGKPQVVPHDDLSIEHVLPRKPGLNSPWRESFPDPGERDRCTESLGNLVLVRKAHNDRAGNLDFSRKKEVLFKSEDALALTVNADVAQQSEWTAKQIKERETKLLQHLDQLWRIGPMPVRYSEATYGSAQRRKKAQAG